MLNRGTVDTTSTSAPEKALPPALTLTSQCLHVSHFAPRVANSVLVLRASEDVAAKVHLLTWTLYEECLWLPQPLFHSAARNQAASCLYPFYLQKLQDDFFISFSNRRASVNLNPRLLCLLFAPCFCNDFDVFARGDEQSFYHLYHFNLTLFIGF